MDIDGCQGACMSLSMFKFKFIGDTAWGSHSGLW